MGWLHAQRAAGAIIGGVAASLLGRPRLTRDIDLLLVLSEDRWDAFLRAGIAWGFIPRRADAVAFARRARVLLVRHEPSRVDVDIVFGALPFEEEAVARVQWTEMGGLRLPLPRPEDLIIMKAVANRGRDWDDIAALLAAHPKINLRRVRRVVCEFAAAADLPRIVESLENLLARSRKRRK